MVCLDETGRNWVVVRANAESAVAAQGKKEHYLGGVKSRGIRAYALSESTVWCGSRVSLKIISERPDRFTDGTVRFFIEQLGKAGMVGQGLCPQATSLEVWGYVADTSKLFFRGVASVEFDWELQTVSMNKE